MTDKQTKENQTLFLKHGQPLLFGENHDKGIILDGLKPKVVSMDEYSKEDLWIHDETDQAKAGLLSRFFDNDLPRPFGVLYCEQRECYEDALHNQIDKSIELKGEGNLDDLLSGNNSWTVD
jgi:2-oxoglutarate ferredoxin oxidoreductase subunit beta